MSKRTAAKASRATESVDALLDVLTHPQRPLVDALRALIAKSVPASVESIKWNAPSFALAEHFATFNLRATSGVQLVLHLGAKPRTDVDMRKRIVGYDDILEFKSADRAILIIQDLAQFKKLKPRLARLLTEWSSAVV